VTVTVSSTVPVRLVDVPAEFDEIGAELTAAMDRTLRRGAYVLGPEVAAFEQEFAAYCGAGNAVGVDSGTPALELILRALGIGTGDEVVTRPRVGGALERVAEALADAVGAGRLA
jgi:dTDP-4-amino-4,6-dideoxygalactose transaminase